MWITSPLVVPLIIATTTGVGEWRVPIVDARATIYPCIVTALTDDYVLGHEVFLRSLLRHNPWFADTNWPLIVIDQGLSYASRARVNTLYRRTQIVEQSSTLVPTSAVLASRDAMWFKWRVNLLKIFQIFEFPMCSTIVKVDTGDMLVMGSVAELLHVVTRRRSSDKILAVRTYGKSIWINCGLMVFGARRLLHVPNGTLEQLQQITRSRREYREQELMNHYFR